MDPNSTLPPENSSSHAEPDIMASSGKPVQVASYLQEGWKLFIANPGQPIVYTLVLLILHWIPQVGPLVAALLWGPLIAGYYIALRKQVFGEPVRFSDYLQGFNNPAPLVLVGVVGNLLIGIGTVLLVLPGIYLAVSYLFSILLVVDRHLDFWTALETSRKFITRQWLLYFVLALILFALNAVGALLFHIGLLLTLPFSTATVLAAYHNLIGLQVPAQTLPAPPIP